MPKEKLNQDEREDEDIEDEESDDETQNSNDSDGDDSEDTSDSEEDSDDSSEDEEALKVYNERVGKNYKSWDDVAKSEKERDKLFAEKGQKKPKEDSKPTPQLDDEVVEEILLNRDPNAEYVMDEIKEIAKAKGVSILKAYKDNAWLSEKAAAEAKKDGNKKKVSSPSNQVRDDSEDSEEKKIEKRLSGNLPPGFSDNSN